MAFEHDEKKCTIVFIIGCFCFVSLVFIALIIIGITILVITKIDREHMLPVHCMSTGNGTLTILSPPCQGQKINHYNRPYNGTCWVDPPDLEDKTCTHVLPELSNIGFYIMIIIGTLGTLITWSPIYFWIKEKYFAKNNSNDSGYDLL